ncbi:MAG: crossover junction endodeoxyribonuclease RuvC, partial [Candidatus Margulisiibacteriota bacterium]
MRILGIDPGLATTGFAILENNIPLEFGVIKTAAGDQFPFRLTQIAASLNDLIQKYQPNTAGIEELFFNTNTKTAFAVAQARGVILYILAKNNVPVISYTPPEVKIAVCGYGKADKGQVQTMVAKLLGLASIPKPDDAADALAI